MKLCELFEANENKIPQVKLGMSAADFSKVDQQVRAFVEVLSRQKIIKLSSSSFLSKWYDYKDWVVFKTFPKFLRNQNMTRANSTDDEISKMQ